jgi:molybdopterin molybdotransferase
MIEIDEALKLIGQRAKPNPAVSVSLRDATGLVIASPIVSDTSTPPFDRALMDGFAVRSSEIVSAETELPVAGTIAAGEATPPPLDLGSSVKIMTGATLPSGADAVVAREQTEELTASVIVRQFPVKPEQNLMRAGRICRAGDVVLEAGHRVAAAELGVLAETGYDSVQVTPAASVAILATGSELVPVGQPLAPGQIRNSNGPMLASMAQELGSAVTDLGIGVDDRDELKRLIEMGLQQNVLLLSGGVSAGDFDLVPEVLKECGVSQVFHKVRLKPGKPIWFGESAAGTLVFGLPGNPVSSLVCFRLFVQPALQQIAGQRTAAWALPTAVMKNEYRQTGDRTTYFPARVTNGQLDNEHRVAHLEVLPWLGSSDLHTFTQANCLAVFPADRSEFEIGSIVEYLPFTAT